MVNRDRMNKPGSQIDEFPVFWLSEHTEKWQCMSCWKTQPKYTVGCEIWVRYARKNADKNEDSPLKKHLCMKCAKKVFEETLEKVNLIKKMGVTGYKMMEDV